MQVHVRERRQRGKMKSESCFTHQSKQPKTVHLHGVCHTGFPSALLNEEGKVQVDVWISEVASS